MHYQHRIAEPGGKRAENITSFLEAAMRNVSILPSLSRAAGLALGLWLMCTAPAMAAEPLTLLVQPILSEEQTRKAFVPLCEFIAQHTKRDCQIQTSPNFLAYWDTIRRNKGYDLALDAAHFTDYRVQKHGFQILAKVPDSVSYSLIAPGDALVIEPDELIGKTIATLGPPSIGAARLNAMYPNPSRQPGILNVNSAEEGLDLVARKRVHGAILPTPVVAQQQARGASIIVVMTTEPIPHIALSASPALDATVREQLRAALIDAPNNDSGRKMLKKIGFERLEPARAEIYANQSKLLKDYWGY
jgi:hypothetical protein